MLKQSIWICTLLALCCSSLATFTNIQTTTYDGVRDDCLNSIDTSPYIRIGKRYYFIEGKEKISWFEAAHRCRTLNGNLATIENAEEMEALSNFLMSAGFSQDDWFWLSGDDLFKEGSFYWLGTGNPFNYFKWSTGQPDNAGGNENCVHLWLREGSFHMNDWGCNNKAHYICQTENPKTISFTMW